jgi:integrase
MSVRKRIWKNSKGEVKEAWVVSYAKRDKDGKRKQHIETFERKKDADARHDQIRTDIRSGTHIAPSESITVRAATELWLEACQSRHLNSQTIAQYETHARIHIIPLIGEQRLSDLTLAGARAFEDRMLLDRSGALVRKVLTSFSSAISDAQERGLVARNVVTDLRRNRRRKGGKASSRANGKLEAGVHIPTPKEITAIIQNASPSSRAVIAVAAFTGLRASELRGLRWIDVDLKKRELHVRQRADRLNVIGAPKSDAGTRTVPFGAPIAKILSEHKLKSGGCELVFPNPEGAIVRLTSLVKGLKSACRRAGVVTPERKAKYTGLHCLRHFYASWSINRVVDGGCGLPAKVVQERLGHANISITLDTYGHLFPRGDDSAILDAAESALLG